MSLARLAVALPLALLFTACPDTGIVCRTGTNRCGTGCADYQVDRRNCGGCGQACAEGEVCLEGACACASSTILCGGRCVSTSSNPTACGGCGTVCAMDEVCEQGSCKAVCTLGVSTKCGSACVDTQTDVMNCGGCGVACQAGQRCVAGSCASEVVVACFSTGQVRGLATDLAQAPLADLGTAPAALAMSSGVLLAVDGFDRKLNQADLPQGSASYRFLANRSIATGAVPNQLVVDGQWVYVVNAESGTLQVVRRAAADGDAGLALSTAQEFVIGGNTFPQGIAKVGSSLWLPLYGGFGASAADAGQRLLEVNVDDPTQPRAVGEVSLKALDLKAFDGGAPVARPWALTVQRGQLYVALNNLNADTYAPEGPGLLAKVDPVSKAVSVIDLGADDCLNPQWVGGLGSSLVVSCGGKADYAGPNFSLSAVEKAGVVVLDANDQKVAAWKPAPPSCGDAGACPLFLPGRFAVKGSTIYLADQNAGRLTVLELTAGGLVERRGPARNDGLAVCPVNAMSGVANIADVLAP